MDDLLPLETPRMRVRRLRADDLRAFQAMRHDEEVGRWQGWTPIDDEAARAFLADMADGPWLRPGAWCQLALADRASDAFVGDIGLFSPAQGDGAFEIGFSLSRDAQGRGLAREALAALLPAVLAAGAGARMQAIVDTRNDASVRLLQRLGFRLAGTEDAEFRGLPCREHHFLLEPTA